MKSEININIRLTGNKNKLFTLNKYIFILKFVILILCIKISEENLRKLINFSSEIHLVVRGSGNQSILNDSFYLKPSKVLVNGELRDSCDNFCVLEYEENNITLYFDVLVDSCKHMFSYSENITEIDLSLFDFSNVTTMYGMFRNCINLKTINFGNINTSLVNSMELLFYFCKKLTSIINLSNFNTSSVISMRGMFGYCFDLLSIDLSNFNTKNVESFRTFFV